MVVYISWFCIERGLMRHSILVSSWFELAVCLLNFKQDSFGNAYSGLFEINATNPFTEGT